MEEDEEIYCIKNDRVIDVRNETKGHPECHSIIIDKKGTFELNDKIYADDFKHYKIEDGEDD